MEGAIAEDLDDAFEGFEIFFFLFDPGLPVRQGEVGLGEKGMQILFREELDAVVQEQMDEGGVRVGAVDVVEHGAIFEGDGFSADIGWRVFGILQEAVEDIRQGHHHVKAGRTRPAAEFLSDLRQKHGFPR